MKKVLIPVDGSQYSLESIRIYKELQLSAFNELHLLNVQTIGLPYESYNKLAGEHNLIDSLRQDGEDIIAQAAKLLDGDNYIATVRIGDIIAEILAYAEEIDASLIIVGSHGKSALSSVILGSVTAKLLSNSKIPLLVSRI